MLSPYQGYADITFLALTVWREARGEPREAQVAVAWTVLTRASRPGWWGRSITSCLWKRWQFSSLTDPTDRQLTTWPEAEDASWQHCLEVAYNVCADTERTPFPDATHYHDVSIAPPNWATDDGYRGQLGRLKFYQAS
jgi:N-acetylmuramoyl-L-alanine amidase